MGPAQVEVERSTFGQQVGVSIEISAPAEDVWALLTSAEAQGRWNSTLASIEGEIREGGLVRLQIHEAPGRTFKLKVSDVTAPAAMTWSDGFAPMFRGVRRFRVKPTATGCLFEMNEVIRGLMFPLIVGSLPDFAPIFETYASDLKRAAEAR